MAKFMFLGETIDVPAMALAVQLKSCDPSAWRGGLFTTVKLLSAIDALRVHTNDRAFPGRDASPAQGKWILIGDIILTSTQIADSRALPVDDPRRSVAFTHMSEVRVAPGTVLNIGVASSKFGGTGGGMQAEYLDGPPMVFIPLTGKHWHRHAGLS